MNDFNFSKDDYKLLIELKDGHAQNVARISKLETENEEQHKEIQRQKKIIQTMVWASSRVALCAGGGFAGLVGIGYWLADTLHFKAVEAFFKTLRGE